MHPVRPVGKRPLTVSYHLPIPILSREFFFIVIVCAFLAVIPEGESALHLHRHLASIDATP